MAQNTDNIRLKQEENLEGLFSTASMTEMVTVYFSDSLSDEEAS